MKKSQVLAALALAFALGLGVVAPVANTYAEEVTPPAISVTTPAQKVSAATLNEAIKKAEGNAKYQAALIIEEAGATTTPAKYTDMNETSLLSALNTAITTLNAKYVSADYKETLAEAITLAKSTITAADYTAYSKVYDVVKNPGNYTYAQAKAIVEGAGLEVNDEDVAEADKTVTNLVTKVDVSGSTYKKYEGLIDAVKDAEDAGTNQTKNVNALVAALEAWNYQSATRINDAKNTTLKKDGTAGPLKELVKLAKEIVANDATALGKYVTGATSLKQEITDAKNAAKGTDEAANATALNALEEAYYAATGVVLGSVVVTPGNSGTNATTTVSATTKDTTVTVTSDFADSNIAVNVEKSDKEVEVFNGHKYAMFDITLTKDGATYKFDGTAVVTIKVPEGINGEKAGVYYVAEDGKVDFMKGAKFNKEANTFTFSTTHFSLYAIVEDAAAGLPNTGVIAAAVEGNASTTVAMVAGIATALTAAGAGVVAYRNARRSVRK